MSGKPMFYWDSAVFIAWIKDEEREPSEMEGLEKVVELVERNKAIIVTSTLWRVEVLDSTLTDEQKTALKKLFERQYITDVAADSKVMDLAHEIRDYYQKIRLTDNTKPKISTPDAIHLATAIHYNVTEFHTFDGANQRGVGKLISLSGNVANQYNLKICTPSVRQLSLNFNQDD